MPKKNESRAVVKSYTGENGAVIIEYSDGSKHTTYPLVKQGEDSKKITTTSSTGSSSKTYSGGKSTGGNYGSSYSSSSYGGYNSYSSNKPAIAFKAFGIEFWGTPKHKLDDVLFEDGDLIINCTGITWTPKRPPTPKVFAKQLPDWMKLPEVLLTPTSPHNFGERAQQLLLDWPDMKSPPEEASLDFWSAIIEQAVENGIKRIFCCCMAGQGRTGTALTALLLATGAVDEPDVAIDYIRENYNDKAVETKGQEEYLFGLIYEPVEDTEDNTPKKTI